MLQNLQNIFLFCSAWIVIVPLVPAILFFRRYPVAYKILSIHVAVACSTELTAYLLSRQGIGNLPLLHVYTLLEFSLLYLFFEQYFHRFYPVPALRLVAVGFIVFSVFNSLFIQPLYRFNSYARATEAFILTILSLLCFYKLSQDTTTPAGMGWINTGLLLYFSGSFILFVLSNYLLAYSKSLNFQIWGLHALLSILLYTFIATGLWKARKS